MKDLFSKNMDIVDHVINSELEKIAAIVEQCSDKTKISYIPSYEEELTRDANDFALILYNSKHGELRKYAIYNPELTELNMAFLMKNQNTLPEEVLKVAATNLTRAAKKFKLEIPEELSKYASNKFISRLVNTDEIDEKAYFEKISKIKTKSETSHKKFALHGKYPINNKRELEKAAQWFNRNYNYLSVDEIEEFTTNIKSTNEPVTGMLEKYAALEKTEFNPDFYNHINVRKAQLRANDQEGMDLYDDLLKKADEIGSEKVAYVLEVIDKELGVDQYYGTVILNPFESTYGHIKTAGVKFNDKFVTLEKLKKMDMDNLSMVVGNDITKELRSNDGLAVFESLPTPIKNEIANLL